MNTLYHITPVLTSHPRLRSSGVVPKILLIGPYDPMGGEYTFLAPPLGVWRLCGVLSEGGVQVGVFDPNCCDGAPEAMLRQVLGTQGDWDVVGISTTGMTLKYDLSLAHLVHRVSPRALLVGGGMEATFNPEMLFELGPFDLVVLGEGERPLLELAERLRRNEPISGIEGTALPMPDGSVCRRTQRALDHDELKRAIFSTPYASMPYEAYWKKLEAAYDVHALPLKAEREARLAEIRSVRLVTLNYCPMGCTFCSSTNFLNVAQGGTTARIARLDDEECFAMVQRIISCHPTVRTIIFQDDIFVFTQDKRIIPLCERIIKAKASGALPPDLQFISTNRIDAMTNDRLSAMRCAGFRVLGFGVESFSEGILREFNKAQIFPYIAPVLKYALEQRITPFLDMILTSPRCLLEHLAYNIARAYEWIVAGCEVGMYPYVIPFSGAAMAADLSLRPHTVYTKETIEGTDLSYERPAKILPVDSQVRNVILAIESDFETRLAQLSDVVLHIPSRARSLLWIAAAIPILDRVKCTHLPSEKAVAARLMDHIPAYRRRLVS